MNSGIEVRCLFVYAQFSATVHDNRQQATRKVSGHHEIDIER